MVGEGYSAYPPSPPLLSYLQSVFWVKVKWVVPPWLALPRPNGLTWVLRPLFAFYSICETSEGDISSRKQKGPQACIQISNWKRSIYSKASWFYCIALFVPTVLHHFVIQICFSFLQWQIFCHKLQLRLKLTLNNKTFFSAECKN